VLMPWAFTRLDWSLRRYSRESIRPALTCLTWVPVFQRTLAVRGGETGSGLIIGEWHFDNETLKWGNDILAHAAENPLLILDELGPLELERGVGLTNGRGLIAERSYRLACVTVRPSLLETAQKLWAWGEIFDVHPSNPAEASI
jgi:hypothetical protein